MKYFSRKFILTLIALIGCLGYAFISDEDPMKVAAVITAIGVLVGGYGASNVLEKGRK